MAQKRNKPKDEAKHKAILKSATQLFLKHGFSNTSMDLIAENAKVTKQTVYSHYQSKDVLFKHMVAEISKKHAPPDVWVTTTDRPISELLNDIGMALLTMLTSKEGLAATRLVIAEIHHHPQLAKRYYEDGTQRMVNILAQFLKDQKSLFIKDAPAASACFFSMLKGRYYVQMLLGIRPTPQAHEKERHVKETVENFLKLYGKK